MFRKPPRLDDRSALPIDASFVAQMDAFEGHDISRAQVDRPRSSTSKPCISKRQFLYALETHSMLVVLTEEHINDMWLCVLLKQGRWISSRYSLVNVHSSRTAAIEAATQLAYYYQLEIGESIGYEIPFECRMDAHHTQFSFVTASVLMLEIQKDPLLSTRSCVILYDIHQMNTQLHLCISLVAKIQKKRTDLRIIVTTPCSSLLQQLETLFSPQTTHVINTLPLTCTASSYYLSNPTKDYLSTCLKVCQNIHKSLPLQGHFLIYLPSRSIISMFQQLFNDNSTCSQLRSVPLLGRYSHLPLERDTCRSCFLSTPTASHQHLPLIQVVIECGLTLTKYYDPVLDAYRTLTHAIDQSLLKKHAQQASIACYNLFPLSQLTSMSLSPPLSLLSEPYDTCLLQLIGLGIQNIETFPLYNRPQSIAVARALATLSQLQIIDETSGQLTELGQYCKNLVPPLSPRDAVVLIQSTYLGCAHQVAVILAMLLSGGLSAVYTRSKRFNTKQVDAAHRKFYVRQGDMFTLYNIYTGWIASNQSSSWCEMYYFQSSTLQLAHRCFIELRNRVLALDLPFVSCESDPDVVEQALLKGWIGHTAQLTRDGNTYHTLKGKTKVRFDSTSTLCSEYCPWVVYHRLVQDEEDHSNHFLMHHCMKVSPSILLRLAPDLFTLTSTKDTNSSSVSIAHRTLF